MENIPESEWLRLGEARTRAVSFFAGSQPADIEAALVDAFHDGKIETEGRCPTWYEHDIRVAIDKHVWDPDRVRVGWTLDPNLDCFERTDDGKKYLFVEIHVKRRDLEGWLATQATDGTALPSGRRTNREARSEEQCGEWLGKLTTRPDNKETAYAAAKAAVAHVGQLSRKAFERQWDEKTPSDWKIGGRRKKSPPPEI